MKIFARISALGAAAGLALALYAEPLLGGLIFICFGAVWWVAAQTERARARK